MTNGLTKVSCRFFSLMVLAFANSLNGVGFRFAWEVGGWGKFSFANSMKSLPIDLFVMYIALGMQR